MNRCQPNGTLPRSRGAKPVQDYRRFGRAGRAICPPLAAPPPVPDERPPAARQRTRIMRAAARWAATALAREPGGPAVASFLAAVGRLSWGHEIYPYVAAYLDAPKSIDDLRGVTSVPRRGYDIHHIVERASAMRDAFPPSMIDGADNLVRVSTLKHWEITAWYNTRNDSYGGLTPRLYLRERTWEERRAFGMKALIRHGVLAPWRRTVWHI